MTWLWPLLYSWDAQYYQTVCDWARQLAEQPFPKLPIRYPFPLPEAVAASAAFLTGDAKAWKGMPAWASGVQLEQVPLTGRPRLGLPPIQPRGKAAAQDETSQLQTSNPGK